MRITESKLRRIIRQVIRENDGLGGLTGPHMGLDSVQAATARAYDEEHEGSHMDRRFGDSPSDVDMHDVDDPEPPKYLPAYDLGGMPHQSEEEINPEWLEWSERNL